MSFGWLETGEAFALGCALVWSVAVLFFRKSGEVAPPVVLNLFKNNLALVLLLVSMQIARSPLFPAERTWGDWVTLLVSGVLGIAIADSLFFASLNRLGAGRSAIVDCLYSPLVLVCAVFYLGEPVRPRLLIALALVGAAVMIAAWESGAPATRRGWRESAGGIAMGAAAMLAMAVGIVFAKPVLERSDVWWATTVRLLGAVPVLTAQAVAPRYRPALRTCYRPGPHWKALVPGSILGAYVALLLWILGFKHAEAGVAGVLNQTSTIWVVLLAAVFLRERLTWRKGVAVVLGFCGAVTAG